MSLRFSFLKNFKNTKVLIAIILTVFAAALQAAALPSVIGISDIKFEQVYSVGKKTYNFGFISGMILKDGENIIKIADKEQRVIVKSVPPELNSLEIEGPTSMNFKVPVYVVDLKIRKLNFEKSTSNVRKLNTSQIVVVSDEVQNVGDVYFIPPVLEKVDLLDSQLPVSNIRGIKFLLASKSPYKFFGKTVLPSNSALYIEENTELFFTFGGSLTVSGELISLGPIRFSGSSRIELVDEGILNLSGDVSSIVISSNGGACVSIVKAQSGKLELSKTNYLIIKDSVVDEVVADSVNNILIINSQVKNLSINNSAVVYINKSKISNAEISFFTNLVAYDSMFQKIVAKDMSILKVLRNNVGTIETERGTKIFLKDSQVSKADLSSFSIIYSFETKISNLNLSYSKGTFIDSKIVSKKFDERSLYSVF